MPANRPNILFLMSDQHRCDVAGFAGNPIVHTPTLDRLARDGVIFNNAYTPSPICVPGRQCMMSGQLPETCNCRNYGDDLTPNYMTFAKRFSQYAYNTVCAGKLHHMGADQMQGWTARISPDAHVSPRYLEGKIDEEFARYTPAPGTGKWNNQKEVERAGIGYGPYHRRDFLVKEDTKRFIEEYFNDPFYDSTQSHRPLLLKMSLIQPHYPYFTDEEKFNYYLNRVPLYTDHRCEHPILSLSQTGVDVTATERDIRRATAAYYGMVETVDQYIAEILQTLEQVGQNLDDWIILYTSDHGEMLGQHGIWEKIRFYEASVRVPLFIRWPKAFSGGKTVSQNVNLCDLFATLCDLCELPAPDGLDSRSLVPLLHGDTSNWNNESVSQYTHNHLMIKQDDLKYQYYADEAPEVLFDLANDPDELHNIIDLPEYADAATSLRARRRTLGVGPDATKNYVNAGY